MNELDKRALDRWITKEPDYFEDEEETPPEEEEHNEED